MVKLMTGAFYIWAISVFTSITNTSGYHSFMVIPGVYAAYQLINSKKYFVSKSQMWMGVFTLVTFLSIIMNLDIIESPFFHFRKTKYYIALFLTPYALYFFRDKFRDPKFFSRLFHLICIFSAIASVTGMIALKLGYNPLKFGKPLYVPGRNSGLYHTCMTYAYGLSMFLVMKVSMLINFEKFKDKVNFKVLIITLVINCVGLYFSFTRGGVLAFLVISPLCFWWKNRKVTYSLFSMVIVVVVVIAGLKASGKFDGWLRNKTVSNQTRITQYKAALYAFKESPIYGKGYRNFSFLCRDLKKKYNITKNKIYLAFRNHAHNNYLEVLSGTGILGFISFMMFFFFWIVELRSTVIMKYIGIPMVFNFLFSGLFQSTINDGANLFFVSGIYAFTLLEVFYIRDKKISESSIA
jgi:O-antigen ligase